MDERKMKRVEGTTLPAPRPDVELLGPSRGYVDMLDEATTRYLKKDTYNKTPIRPSAAGKCARELYFELMEFSGRAQYPKELKSPEVHRLLNLGHSVEYHVIKQFELLKDLFEIRYKQQVLSFTHYKAERDPKLTQWLEGSLDLVFWSDKYKCVADVKSKKDSTYGRKRGWESTAEKLEGMASVVPIDGSGQSFYVDDLAAFLDELKDPFFAANFLQLNLYANSQFLLERGINHGAILQYNKNTSEMREVRFKPSRELYEKNLTKFGNVIKAVDLGQPELAPKEHEFGSMKCRYCPFSKQCWGKK